MAIFGQPDPRNQNLNTAYTPPWQGNAPAPSVLVPQGNTQFDPFKGTGWGDWLDALGAGDPGGANVAAMKGLKSAAGLGDPAATPYSQAAGQPQVQQPAVAGLASVDPDQSTRLKMGLMKNQEQKAANFYPNATNYAYKPFGNY